MILFRVFISAILFFLITCTTSPLSQNGTGTDAGEAKIIGTALLPGNMPGKNAAIALRKQNYTPFSLPPSQQKHTTANGNGAFILDQIGPGYYLMELRNNDSLGAIKRLFIPNDSATIDLDTIVLDTLAQYTGKVLSSGTPDSTSLLLVMGMDKQIHVADDGSFSIILPRGEQLFRIVHETGLPAKEFLFSDKNSGDTLFLNNIASTVFEDFNRMDGYNNLNALLGSGWWWAFSDGEYGGKSRVVPTTQVGLTAAIDTTANAYSGGSLHVGFQVDSLFIAPCALIGSDISENRDTGTIGKDWFDLRKMTAITFMAKGSGTIYLQFTSKYVNGSDAYVFPFEIPCDLTPTWKKYTINSTSIQAATIPNTTITTPWSSGAALINNMTFLAKKNVDLWLDDIVIEGMNPTDFLP
ncbi:MAG: hypothetical protein JW913_17985 [Chitinispirillaceae bacterium]|nr:hypothetical protein [Chitinispirillaceae bacterium]